MMNPLHKIPAPWPLLCLCLLLSITGSEWQGKERRDIASAGKGNERELRSIHDSNWNALTSSVLENNTP